ncbi:MAG: hypothetical protein CVU56_11805 [Deltaproteobacteria bacterium HGW-Deltaproteobacteria-14]|nr:MAG: hypothetical protein CVU56_11805 [Deltaproteobacteria bacterium HGW-Deltaproteobacteria-14]
MTGCSESEGGCVELSNTCACDVDADCANTTLCDGEEFCNSKRDCEGGVPVTCDDPGDVCLVASCVPATGTCIVQNASTTTSCDDGNACTVGDHCQAGTCKSGNPASDAFGDWNLLLGRHGEATFQSFGGVPITAHVNGSTTLAIGHTVPYPVYAKSFSGVPVLTLAVDDIQPMTLDLVTYAPNGSSVVATTIGRGTPGSISRYDLASVSPAGATAVFLRGPAVLGNGASLPSDTYALIAVAGDGSFSWMRTITSTGPFSTAMLRSTDSDADQVGLITIYGGAGATIADAASQPPLVLSGPGQALIMFAANGDRLWVAHLPVRAVDRGSVAADRYSVVAASVDADLEFETPGGTVVVPKLGTSLFDLAVIGYGEDGRALWGKTIASAGNNVTAMVRTSAGGPHWIVSVYGKPNADAAFVGPDGVEAISTALADENSFPSVFAAIADDGTLLWTHRLPSAGPTNAVRLSTNGQHLRWLASVESSTTLDGVTLEVADSTTAMYAIEASSLDGTVTGAQQVAASVVNRSNAWSYLDLATNPAGALYACGRMKGTTTLGGAVQDTVTVDPNQEGLFLMRLNSGDALFCP